MNIKIKKNSKNADLNSAQYTLFFKSTDDTANYKVLSALIQDNDLIIEINSSRFMNTNIQKEEYFKEILEYLRSNDLDYTYSKVVDNSNQSIFGNIFNKNQTAHQTIVYLPNKIWRSSSFRSIIPISGARYYILNTTNDKDILGNMNQMMDNEILNYFQLIAFDPGLDKIQQMGINTSMLSKSQVENLLANI